MIRRFGQIGELREDKIQEYIGLHADVWPKVLQTITECNIQNYSIYIKNKTVFAYYEYYGINYEKDMQKMADDKVTQEWWAYTKPCFKYYPLVFYEDMKEIFHYS